MKLIIKFFGVLLVLWGILLFVNPDVVFNSAEENIGNLSFYISVIVGRLTIGTLFIMVANESKYPVAIKFFGYLTLIGALVVIILGHKGFQDLMASLIPVFEPYSPVSGLMGIAFGGFLFYAFLGNKELGQK